MVMIVKSNTTKRQRYFLRVSSSIGDSNSDNNLCTYPQKISTKLNISKSFNLLDSPISMMEGGDMANILAFSGSTRVGSFNKKILQEAVIGAKDAGAHVTLIELSNYDLPLYDGDLEHREGIPKNALKLKELFLSNHGLLLALPEYNSSMSGVFKNVIDWVSRPTEDEDAPLSCFKHKTAALMSASPSHLGGARGLVHAKSMLENIHVQVLAQHVCVAHADNAFDDEDILKDETTRLSIEKLGFYLAHLLAEEIIKHPLDPEATAPSYH